MAFSVFRDFVVVNVVRINPSAVILEIMVLFLGNDSDAEVCGD